MELTSKCANY